jgi:hypothetical protein
MRLLKLSFTFLIIFILSGFQSAQSQSLYKVTLFRAAPGELLSLIDNLKGRVANYQELGGDKPFIVRHSQGDQWDLMVYEHISTYEAYFKNHIELNNVFTPEYGDSFYAKVAFHETIFAEGSSYDIVAELFDKNGYFHVEMFVALPGKQTELLKQRQMENVYLKEIGRDPNLIFTSILGGQWDNFTLGGYRDIKHYAESADIPIEVEEKAAIKAGFKGVTDISPYLRSLIAFHHDTLGGKVD